MKTKRKKVLDISEPIIPDKIRNDTPPRGRPRVMTAVSTQQIVNLQAKLMVLSADPCPKNVVGVICAYMEADLYGFIPPDTVLRGKSFLEMLYKKYDPSVLEAFGFVGGQITTSGTLPPRTLSIPQKQIEEKDNNGSEKEKTDNNRNTSGTSTS